MISLQPLLLNLISGYMKNPYVLFFLIFLTGNVSYCQLLDNPALTVKDFEEALSNPDHLRGLLLEHKFKYEKFENEECIASECWQSLLAAESISSQEPLIVTPLIDICIYEFKPDRGPMPGIIKSVNIQIYKDPAVAEGLDMFVENIRSSYPEKNVRGKEGSNPSLIYNKKGSEIEVEVINSQTKISKSEWYLLIFNLYESPYF